MFDVQWFKEIKPAAAPETHGAYHQEAETTPRPQRDLEAFIRANLHRFRLPEGFPLEEALAERYIPPHVAFGAAPVSLTIQEDPSAETQTTFHELIRLPLEEERHMATVGDLLWILPSLEHPPWRNVAVLSPLYREPSRPEEKENRLFRFRRLEGSPEVGWVVQNMTYLLRESVADYPMTVMALCYRRGLSGR